MRTVERIWRISLAAALMTTVWAAAAPAADLPNTPAARPATTATPAKPVSMGTRHANPAAKSARSRAEPVLRLASARDCYVSCREHFLLIVGVAY
jgi:hypothetical protein